MSDKEQLTEDSFLSAKDQAKSGVVSLLDRINTGELGFSKTVEQDITSILEYAKSVKGQYNDLIVVGIGGSSLGIEALVNAILPYGYNALSFSERGCFPRIWVADNVDPHKIHWMMKHCDPSDTLVCVITKSGSTVETVTNFSLVYNWLKESVEDISKHLVAVTDSENGLLRTFVDNTGIKSFDVPQNIGGRFSVLSPVGLLPAALLGIDIDTLLKGAKSIVTGGVDKVIILSALYIYFLNKGVNINVMMPYSSRLEKFSEWFCQLWGESLGRKLPDGTRLGSTPVAVLGAIDQHSQIQLYIEGPDDKLITFVELGSHDFDKPISSDFFAGMEYLNGHHVGDLLNTELRCTELALLKEGKPNLTLKMDNLDESSLGALMMLYQYVIPTIGLSYQINPFNQPGVEEGKRFAYGLLGRESFEEKQQEFNKLYSKIDDYII